MPSRALPSDLAAILRGTSRSFYLTLRVVPRAVRLELAAAYLFCRAADTIADTRLLPPERRQEQLAAYRAQFEAETPRQEALAAIAAEVGTHLASAAEEALLLSLGRCFAVYAGFDDGARALVRRLVTTLVRGMEIDLARFPSEESGEVGVLEDDAELDLYCYHVAGCVGEFWTDLALDRLRALSRWARAPMRELGVRFGKGLQMTNVLRDVDADLRIGRCYLPRRRLEAVGLSAAEVHRAPERSRLRPLVHDLLRATLEHYRAGFEYTLAIPRRLPALRLACAWPLLIGLATLELLAAASDPCAPGVVRKIDRRALRGLMRASALRCFSNRGLERLFAVLEARVLCRLESRPVVAAGAWGERRPRGA